MTLHRIRSLWNTVPLGDAAKGINAGVLEAVRWFYRIVLTAGFLGMGLVLTRPDRGAGYHCTC